MNIDELKIHIEKRYSECSKRDIGLSYGSFYDGYMDCYSEQEKRIAELEKENRELRAEWQEQVQKATDEGYARTLQTIQLTKAKELLKWFVWYFREGSPNLVPYKHKVTEAEQFLKDSEVEK